MKKILCLLLGILLLPTVSFAEKPTLDIDAKACFLTESESGEVLYENNADERLPIASVTKIMTMLLIAEAVDNGKITLNDEVCVSDRAMSMGGSTMFLEAGDKVTVDEMLKGIAVASANDGAVAMAEYISGSEAEFVKQMNEKAKSLGMNNTAFVNTNGLDADGHYSSARDVAIMSRELLKHPMIFDYTTIWTDTIRGGKYELANTNKLIRFYDGANGLKTGSTSNALCCLSASAKRDNMQLIAVILGAPNSKSRFGGARTLLDYGFSAYNIRPILTNDNEIEKIAVTGGTSDSVGVSVKENVNMLVTKGDTSDFKYSIQPKENLTAPVYKGDEVGEAVIFKDDSEIKRVPVFASEEVIKKTFVLALSNVIHIMCS